MNPRFLQVHTLTSYPASLLNRDDVGFAKRQPFGGVIRTRISSQCLKRHWRTSDSEYSLATIKLSGELVPMSIRSRRTFEKFIYEPLVSRGIAAPLARAATEELLTFVFPKGKRQQAQDAEGEEATTGEVNIRTSQITVIGRPEIEYLLVLAEKLLANAKDENSLKKAAAVLDQKDLRKNLQALAQGAGLDAALFGRMTTGDVLARCDAAIHVAHSLTVHEGEFETDYFSAIDDLQGPEETGSGHINTTELTAGLFYGYVVVDVPLLVSNLEGCERTDWLNADRVLSAEVVRRLIHLIATVSPGAKLGSTAPYAHASMVIAEAGDRLPRTFANAFLCPVRLRESNAHESDGYDVLQGAYSALARFLSEHDRMYGSSEQRRIAAQNPPNSLIAYCGQRADIDGLATWAAEILKGSP